MDTCSLTATAKKQAESNTVASVRCSTEHHFRKLAAMRQDEQLGESMWQVWKAQTDARSTTTDCAAGACSATLPDRPTGSEQNLGGSRILRSVKALTRYTDTHEEDVNKLVGYSVGRKFQKSVTGIEQQPGEHPLSIKGEADGGRVGGVPTARFQTRATRQHKNHAFWS